MKYCDTCRTTYPTEFAVCPKDQAPLRETEELLAGMILRGKYEILDKIGSGGMAAVYRAKHLTFNEIRAIKVVSNQLARDEKFLKRFKNEAIIARKLRHPNAVHIDDFDTTDDGRPFIVMDYVEGKNLRTVLHEGGPMPAQRAVRIARQVTAALDAAHKLGIVHRDIKPDNILIVPMPAKSEYGSDIAKVLDFGIATVREGGPIGTPGYTPTQTSVVVGTPQYISPEQAMGKPGSEIDGRADLYSLGAVLYEMLTGAPPFDSDTPIGVLLQHLQAQAKPPRERCPQLDIPAKVSALVMRALEKEPGKRFQSAEEMTRALSDPEHWDASAAPAAPPAAKAAAAAAIPEFEVKPAPPPTPPPPAHDDDLDVGYKGRDRDSGVRFAGVDFEAMKKAQLPPELEPEEPPPLPPPKKTPTIVAGPPTGITPKPSAAPPAQVEAKPAPGVAVPTPPPRPRPTPPPGPAPAPQAKPSPSSRPGPEQTHTFYKESTPKGPGVALPALPAWLPKAGYIGLGALLLLILAVFAWNRMHAPAASPQAAATGTAPTRDDALVLQDVKQALHDSPTLRRIPIQVSVQQGVVTLMGRTNNANIPGFAQAVVGAIPGVVQVDNQIDVVTGAAGYGTSGRAAPSAGRTDSTTTSSPRPAPFGGATQEAPPVAGALPSASDENVGVQQMRIQQAIDMGNYRLGQGDYPGAARAFRRALALDPNNAAAKQGLLRAERGR